MTSATANIFSNPLLDYGSDPWTIDGTTFMYWGQWYSTRSGWAGDSNRQQNIYLCRMTNLWIAGNERIILSEPMLPWEQHNHNLDPASPRNRIFINESPTALIRDDRVFLVYPASGCWTDHYCLGMLTLAANTDPMTPQNWTKSDRPILETSSENGVYAPSHNCFFQSPNGEDWLLYHASPEPGLGCGDKRTPRIANRSVASRRHPRLWGSPCLKHGDDRSGHPNRASSRLRTHHRPLLHPAENCNQH